MAIQTRTTRVLAGPGECSTCTQVAFSLVDPVVSGGSGQVRIYNISGGCAGCLYEFSVDGSAWVTTAGMTPTGDGGFVFSGLAGGASYTMRGRCQGDATTEGTRGFTVPAAQTPVGSIQYRNRRSFSFPNPQAGTFRFVEQADIWVVFTTDSGTPMAVSNVSVNYREYGFDAGGAYDTDKTIGLVQSSSERLIEFGANITDETTFTDGSADIRYRRDFALKPGTGYAI